MNILHVLSQFEVTGAEVYAATLINEQIRHGHTVMVVSDTFSTPIWAPYLPMPIGKRSYLQRLSNIRSLVRLIRDRRIDLLHAHSRAASWLAYFAARKTRTAFVSTIHGRQHVHASSKSFSIYGRDIIAVSESISEHLHNDLGIPREHIAVIPNGLSAKLWQPTRHARKPKRLYDVPTGTKVILFVGRLSGPKGDVARDLASKALPLVLKKCRCVLYVIGGEIGGQDFAAMVETLNREIGKTAIRSLGFQSELGPYLQQANVVIGSGRVAIEALALGRPTIAFGESGYLGRITEDNYAEARKSNFGDTGIRLPVDANVVANDLLNTLREKPNLHELHAIKVLTRSQYDIAVVEPQVESVYERAVLRANTPESMPVLMYHRVIPHPDARSKHGIWVTTSQFERQLQSLVRRGFTTITLQQYDDARRGKRALPDKPIILTFDDGYEDNFVHAFPLLRKYHCTAVIFATADRKRRTNHWDADEPQLPLLTVRHMKEMADAGIEIGSHTVSHAKLTALPPLSALREVARSKEVLEQILGTRVISFAYPYGAFHDQVKRLVEQSGYRYAVVGDQGPTWLPEDFFAIRRTQVFPWTSPFGFWKKTQPWYALYKKRKTRDVSTGQHPGGGSAVQPAS